MDLVYGLLSLLALLCSCTLLMRALRPANLVECILFFFVGLVAHIVALGLALSGLEALAKVAYWTAGSVLLALMVAALVVGIRPWRAALRRPLPWPRLAMLRAGWAGLEVWQKVILGLLLSTTLGLGLVNLAIVLWVAPHNWDSMTYHLARMAFFLQQGHLRHFTANYWAQVIHPRNATLLLTYAYLVSNRNENLTQMVQFVSYWVAIAAVYGLARRAGYRRVGSLLAALVFALLTECLMEAITTQNDMFITACMGAMLYGFLAFRETGRLTYLALVGLTLGLALGAKSSVLPTFPALGVVGLYALLAKPRGERHWPLVPWGVLLASTVLAVALFALPSGYWENYRLYGNPIGPEDVRKIHAFEDASPGYILRHGTRNVLRFGIEFLSLDGLPPAWAPVRAVQTGIRWLPKVLTKAIGMDLELKEAVRAPFNYGKLPFAHEDMAYWGILGFALVWPLVWGHLLGRGKAPAGRALAWGALLFFLAQAYVGPYDPWRGRYFIIAAAFAAPPVAALWQRRRGAGVRIYLTGLILLGCLSAGTAVLFRYHSPVVAVRGLSDPNCSVFRMERLLQLTRNRPPYQQPILRFNELVPAEATVLIWLPGDSFQYPLFGARLTRKIIPINSMDQFLSAYYASGAKFFLFSNKMNKPIPTDQHLGEDWYLRRLQ